ncbi:MAG: D-amino-acid dehydrogenase [Thermoleophilaceae bacterium]|nr:D-amino-acid dehydrogenase [Thermoleophilaceae bacterium]
MSSQRVVVVGGGVAGLSTAYFLRRRGAEVTVLESRRMGSAASAVNAGWLCPGQAGPLPEPGLAAYGVRSLLDRDSALYFAPSQLPRMASWLLRFARHCNERDNRAGTAALARLARRTFELTETMAADGVEFELHRRGLLVAAQERAAVESFRAGLEPLRDAGLAVPERVLSGAEVREREPTLAASVSAGLHVEQHWHVHPPTFMAGLSARLREMGVALEEGTEVTELVGADGRVRELRSTAGSFAADAVVLATGAWAPRLARQRGIRLPVQAGKGYSFEVGMARLPGHALLLLEPHVGVSPLGDRLRVGGTMEFSGINERLDQDRVDTIVRGAGRMLEGLESPQPENVWSGMRPIASDGLPIVDRAPRHHNLYLAAAYSMLGMTIAAPAGDALAELILTGRRPPELEPFSAARFARRRARARSAPGPT